MKRDIVLLFLLLCANFSFAQTVISISDTIPPSSNKRSVIGNITMSGNRVTKPSIILRELTFRPGDTLNGEQLLKRTARSRENLLNTSLFNFVTISTTLRPDSLHRDVHIEVKERWYTWPVPIFEIVEQNFNTWWNNGHNLERANYGFYLNRDNFRGRRETVSLAFRFGYSERYGVSYNIPFLNKKQTWGAGFSVAYNRNHEIAYRTQDNKLQFHKDSDRYLREEYGGRISASYRPKLYIGHNFELRYVHSLVDDTLQILNDEYFVNGETRMQYLAASYRYARDHRDAKAYPLRGWFFDAEVGQLGLGILKNENLDVTYFLSSFRRYFRLADRVYLGANVRGKFSPGKNQPYYVQRAFGFGLYVRGYEYYVIDGQSYGLAKTQLRFQVVKPQVRRIPFLPFEKFNTLHVALYGGIFADAGYADDRSSDPALNNVLSNAFLFGTGASLDLVTYYDVVLRLEYSFNRMGEQGLFLHLGAPL